MKHFNLFVFILMLDHKICTPASQIIRIFHVEFEEVTVQTVSRTYTV